MKYTLSERINNFIDSILIALHLQNPSIKTNGQVFKIIQTGIINLNDEQSVKEFINGLPYTYGVAIFDAETEIKDYFRAVQAGDRKKSDELREKIETIIAASPERRDNETFSKMIDVKFKQIDSYSQYLETINFIKNNSSFLQMAAKQGRLAIDSSSFIQALPEAITTTMQPQQVRGYIYSISPQTYKAEIEQLIKSIKEAENGKPCELPPSLNKLKTQIYAYYNIPTNNGNSQNVQDSGGNEKGGQKNKSNFKYIDSEVLKYFKEQYTQYTGLSDIQFLAALGKQIILGQPLDNEEIELICTSSPENLQALYGDEIQQATTSISNASSKKYEEEIMRKFKAAQKAAKKAAKEKNTTIDPDEEVLNDLNS